MTNATALSITELQQKAQEGDAQAQLDLAYRLEKGEGIEKNMELAFYWLRQAAEAGNAEAQYELGISEPLSSVQCLSKSIDCFRWPNSNVNSDEAFLWILKSAEQNYAKSQYVAAMCYFKGDCTQKNPELGANWLMKAAENGLPEAQYKLANCYLNEDGVAQNYEQAYEWLIKFTGHEEGENYDNACMLLGDLYAEGKGIQQSDELAITWYERYVQNIQDSLASLAEEEREQQRWCSISPTGLENVQNKKSACLKQQGDIKNRLASCYYRQATRFELTSKRDAYEWYKKAAETGHGESHYWLSKYYLSGDILEQSEERISDANRYSKAGYHAYYAKENGCAEANLIFGFLMRYGIEDCGYGQPPDTQLAMEAFKEAKEAVSRTEQGIADYFLAEYYRHSNDENELDLARQYSQKADLGKVWEYYGIDKLLDIDSNLGGKISVLLKDSELFAANKELERKNKELEEMMSMFAHKFRSPLDAIIYNTTHGNQQALYTEAAQIMRGLLDVFSAISTDPEMLRNRIRQDKQGKGRLSTLFIKTLDMMMLHLLSVSGAEKIQQHYMAYAKCHGLCDPELSYEAWSEDCLELGEELQSKWEKSYAELLNKTAELEPRIEWLEQRFFKLNISGFDNELIQFRANGVTESFLMILLNEIMVNAFKYYSSAIKQSVALEWVERDGFQVLICRNPSTRSERDTIKGSSKGHAFLSALAHKTGSRFIKPLPKDDFVAEFEIPNDLLLAK